MDYADATTTVAVLKTRIAAFDDARKWNVIEYRSPKESIPALWEELSEMGQHIDGKNEDQFRRYLLDETHKKEFGHEVADFVGHVLKMSRRYNIDLSRNLCSDHETAYEGSDATTEIAQLKAYVAKSRSIDFNSPQEMLFSLLKDVGSLWTPFRFRTPEQVEKDLKENKETIAKFHERLANCLAGILRIASKYEVDISQAIDQKLTILEKKYPLEKFTSRGEKYDEL